MINSSLASARPTAQMPSIDLELEVKLASFNQVLALLHKCTYNAIPYFRKPCSGSTHKSKET